MKKRFGSIDIKVFCTKCGSGLEISVTNTDIAVDPCEQCVGKAYQEGINDGSKQ